GGWGGGGRAGGGCDPGTGRPPPAGERAATGRRDHHRRGVGARLLADAATRAAGRVFTSCRRRGDGEESIRVPGRRLMSESERDPIERQGEQRLKEAGEGAHREGLGRTPASAAAPT